MKRFALLVATATILFALAAYARVEHLSMLRGGDDDSRVTCGETPTLIAPAFGTITARSITVVNDQATAVFIGGSGVTTTGGASVCSSGCHYTTTFATNTARAWCRVASGTQQVRVLWGE